MYAKLLTVITPKTEWEHGKLLSFYISALFDILFY